MEIGYRTRDNLNIYEMERRTKMEQKTGNTCGLKSLVNFIMTLDCAPIPSTIGEYLTFGVVMFFTWILLMWTGRVLQNIVKFLFLMMASMFIYGSVHTLEAAHFKDLFQNIASFVNNTFVKGVEMIFWFLDF